MWQFRNRREAGRALARALEGLDDRADYVVLALPRGGVPVGFEVAMALGAPLEVFTVRKIGAPWNEELALGALASGGTLMIDSSAARQLGVSASQIERTIEHERVELARREQLYRGDRPFPDLSGRTVLLVDDGLATGATMRTAVEALRTRAPEAIIAAAPVGSREACQMLRAAADDCVCVRTPQPFLGVGAFYADFSQTSDDEVLELLERAAGRDAPVTVPPAG